MMHFIVYKPVFPALAAAPANFNASVFFITCEDEQLFIVIDITISNAIRENIGNSRNYGAEIETEVLLTIGLNLTANLGYFNTEFTDFKYTVFLNQEIHNNANEQFLSPHWNENIGLNYDLKLSEKWISNLTVKYRYHSTVWLNPENTYQQNANGLLNSRRVVGIKNLEFALWVKDGTVLTYLSYGYAIAGSGFSASYGLPRTFGTSITAKF